MAGIVTFLGGMVVVITHDHTTGHASWLLAALPFAGGLIASIGQMGRVVPQDFAGYERHWTTFGGGWREID